MRYEVLDEISQTPIIAFEPIGPCDIGPGHVRITIGGFENVISATECTELGRLALNAASLAHGVPKVAA